MHGQQELGKVEFAPSTVPPLVAAPVPTPGFYFSIKYLILSASLPNDKC